MRVRSLIVSPLDGSTVDGTEIQVIGRAWSGSGAIAQVEVSGDGGSSWNTADLDDADFDYAAQTWRYSWIPNSPGRYKLLSRATDSEGNQQPSEQIWNQLGYGNNGPQAVEVMVV